MMMPSATSFRSSSTPLVVPFTTISGERSLLGVSIASQGMTVVGSQGTRRGISGINRLRFFTDVHGLQEVAPCHRCVVLDCRAISLVSNVQIKERGEMRKMEKTNLQRLPRPVKTPHETLTETPPLLKIPPILHTFLSRLERFTLVVEST